MRRIVLVVAIFAVGFCTRGIVTMPQAPAANGGERRFGPDEDESLALNGIFLQDAEVTRGLQGLCIRALAKRQIKASKCGFDRKAGEFVALVASGS